MLSSHIDGRNERKHERQREGKKETKEGICKIILKSGLSFIDYKLIYLVRKLNLK